MGPEAAPGDPRQGRQFDSFRLVTRLLLAAYGAWYFFLAFLIPLSWLLNGLLDDSFYYLQVARNVARGLGSTFDGVELTNGYHPLWMLLLVPVHWVAGSRPDSALRLALGLSALFGLGSLFLLRRLLLRTAGSWAAAIGLLLFAWPRFFGQTVSLLETSLLLFLYLAAISIALQPDVRPAPRKLALGLSLGLACLARLDTVFLLAAAAILGVRSGLRGQAFPSVEESPAPGPLPPDRHAAGRVRPPLLRLWGNLWFLGISILVLLPYLAWNQTRFGHLTPISGAMKTSFPAVRPHWEYLKLFPEFTALLVLGLGFFIASLRPTASRWTRILGLFGLAGFLHMAFTVLFMAWGVDRWHFGLLIPVGLLGIPWLAARGWDRMRAHFSPSKEAFLPWSVLALGCGLAILVQSISMSARGERHLAANRAVALWAHDHLPAESVFGMNDAGVFAYFSDRTTVNLDGLINNYRYLEALRSGRILEYLRDRRIGYIYDQSAYGRLDWLSGQYETRFIRYWYHPENRVIGQIALYRSDEVHRVNLLSRPSAMKRAEPNALILYRYRPEAQLPP